MHAYIILASDTFYRIIDQVSLKSNDIVPNYEQHMAALSTVSHSDLFYGVGKLSHCKDTCIAALPMEYPDSVMIPTIRTSFPRVTKVMPPW